MKKLTKLAKYLHIALLALMVFLLVAAKWISVPLWLQVTGRLHPMLVHFPIVILILAGIVYLIESRKDQTSQNGRALLLIGALSASLSATAGLLLSFEGGYDDSVLDLHKWSGVAVSVLATMIYYAASGTMVSSTVTKSLIVVTIFGVIIAGHLGSNLTHGEDFILAPLKDEKPVAINRDTTLWAMAIHPVLRSKCFGCHDERKSKGKLILTSLKSILKGGKHGALWVAGDPGKSLIIERLELPVDQKKHMPPKDKAQLREDEIALIRQWVSLGADMTLRLEDLPGIDSSKHRVIAIAARYEATAPASALYHFDFASQDAISGLNDPFRSVSQIAQNEPALEVDFFVAKAFEKRKLQDLLKVKDQIISLNLSGMPVDDSDMEVVGQLTNLETLLLNKTGITDKGLADLEDLSHLQMLSLSGTQVTQAALSSLQIPSLRKVFLWNTAVTEMDITKLSSEHPGVQFELGYIPNSNEALQLTPPQLVNENQVLGIEEAVKLKATIPGTIIKYTLDGTAPDSVNGELYTAAISTGAYGNLKTRSLKAGWKTSEVAEFALFRTGYHPSDVKLVYDGDVKYPGLGATTLVDGDKGIMEYMRGDSWIAFREKPLEVYFFFNDSPEVSSVTISFAKDVGAMTMPPAEMEVWGGADEQHLKLLNKITPEQPTGYGVSRIEGVICSFPASRFACYKLVARPLAKLPAFRKAPKDKGWLMVDEIFFN